MVQPRVIEDFYTRKLRINKKKIENDGTKRLRFMRYYKDGEESIATPESNNIKIKNDVITTVESRVL